jgi:hypothetical protein
MQASQGLLDHRCNRRSLPACSPYMPHSCRPVLDASRITRRRNTASQKCKVAGQSSNLSCYRNLRLEQENIKRYLHLASIVMPDSTKVFKLLHLLLVESLIHACPEADLKYHAGMCKFAVTGELFLNTKYGSGCFAQSHMSTTDMPCDVLPHTLRMSFPASLT